MNLRRTLLLATVSLLLPFAAPAQEALRVVTDATFPPMEFVKDGKRTGFDIELTEALATAMGRKVEWIDIDFKGLSPALVSRRARRFSRSTDEASNIPRRPVRPPAQAQTPLALVRSLRPEGAGTGQPL